MTPGPGVHRTPLPKGFSAGGVCCGDDAVIAMYHDQAMIPIKAVAFDEAVNVTLGLPIVRTSPDHGTAFGLAGTGTASVTSMLAAIRLADRMTAGVGAMTQAAQ